jgi:hypothetical protein
MHQKQPPAKVARLAFSGAVAGASVLDPAARPDPGLPGAASLETDSPVRARPDAGVSEAALLETESPVAALPEAELPEQATVNRSATAASVRGTMPRDPGKTGVLETLFMTIRPPYKETHQGKHTGEALYSSTLGSVCDPPNTLDRSACQKGQVVAILSHRPSVREIAL